MACRQPPNVTRYLVEWFDVCRSAAAVCSHSRRCRLLISARWLVLPTLASCAIIIIIIIIIFIAAVVVSIIISRQVRISAPPPHHLPTLCISSPALTSLPPTHPHRCNNKLPR